MALVRISSASSVLLRAVYFYQPLTNGLSVDSIEQYLYIAIAGSPAAVIKSDATTGSTLSVINM